MMPARKTFVMWIAALIFVMASQCAIAEKTINVEFFVENNSQTGPAAQLSDIRVGIGSPDQPSSYNQEWAVSSNSFFSYLPVIFVIFKDTPAPVEKVFVSKKLPYLGNFGRFEVGNGNKVLLSYDLQGLCNGNGYCDKFENTLSCPADCPIKDSDGICLPENDGICDPDCLGSIDTDCVRKVTLPAAVPEKASQGITLSLFALAFSLLFIIYLLTREKKRRKR